MYRIMQQQENGEWRVLFPELSAFHSQEIANVTAEMIEKMTDKPTRVSKYDENVSDGPKLVKEETESVTQETDLPHVTQITLTDQELAFLTNAAQLAVVAVKRHPVAQDRDRFAEVVSTALDAIDTYESETMAGVIQRLVDATEDITDPSVQLRKQFDVEN